MMTSSQYLRPASTRPGAASNASLPDAVVSNYDNISWENTKIPGNRVTKRLPLCQPRKGSVAQFALAVK
jgi:hypothetical protein